MEHTVSKSIESHSSPGLPISRHRQISASASAVCFDKRPAIKREARRNRTASNQALSIDAGLPSPPTSDCEESGGLEDESIAAVRKALKGFHCSRHTSLASHLGSPPQSDSDEACGPSIKKENSLHVDRRRPRRPLKSTFQDGPSDAKRPAPPIGSTDDESDSPPEVTPFPLQPSPITTRDDLGLSRPEKKRIKRRCISTGTHYHRPTSTPDRFIAHRAASQDASHSFHVTKKANELSQSERLFRHNLTAPDPFGSPMPANNGRRRIASSPIRNASRFSSRAISGTNLLSLASNALSTQTRQISTGAVWNVGGSSTTVPSTPISGIDSGRGGMIGSGTNAPMYTSRFFEKESPDQDRGRLESRLAAALEIDQASRVLSHSQSPARSKAATDAAGLSSRSSDSQQRTVWRDGQWVLPVSSSHAPQLRDDYYCSVLAYSETSRTLAVGLGNRVYLWSEGSGVQYPLLCEVDRRNTYVTSLSFSSTAGGHSILAIGRNDGNLALLSLHEQGIKYETVVPNAVACLAFKPVTTRRSSLRFGMPVETEELLLGDELGYVYYYSIEWMTDHQVAVHGWTGATTLVAKINVHSQQICGLAWSPDGEYFATGANDNACCLFRVKDIFKDAGPGCGPASPPNKALQTVMANLGLVNEIHPQSPNHQIGFKGSKSSSVKEDSHPSGGQSAFTATQGNVLEILDGCQKHKWLHSAAIKAIAFCPWQRGLIATGGGSNDRAIHFYHTFSGACLATIDVQAQVTSLIWSTSRREIAATFGYAQPDHPYRIAVFSWPECRQVVAIPWANEMRALLAIAYPGGPNETSRQAGEGEAWWSRTAEEGCIVVASSDESVKFHEVWIGAKKSTGGRLGLLGGSDILEGLEGIDKEGTEIIR
ncbi:MAG: hypothetical protein Q9191_004606 [Dirinaria sp. TL-2023a]